MSCARLSRWRTSAPSRGAPPAAFAVSGTSRSCRKSCWRVSCSGLRCHCPAPTDADRASCTRLLLDANAAKRRRATCDDSNPTRILRKLPTDRGLRGVLPRRPLTGTELIPKCDRAGDAGQAGVTACCIGVYLLLLRGAARFRRRTGAHYVVGATRNGLDRSRGRRRRIGRSAVGGLYRHHVGCRTGYGSSAPLKEAGCTSSRR